MKIRNTITNIINEFFESEGAGNILIYHCDNGDNKNAKRATSFDSWFELAEIKSRYKKYDNDIIFPKELIIKDEPENGLIMVLSKEYLSLIVHADNSKIDIIVNEFQELKEQLITEK